MIDTRQWSQLLSATFNLLSPAAEPEEKARVLGEAAEQILQETGLGPRLAALFEDAAHEVSHHGSADKQRFSFHRDLLSALLTAFAAARAEALCRLEALNRALLEELRSGFASVRSGDDFDAERRKQKELCGQAKFLCDLHCKLGRAMELLFSMKHAEHAPVAEHDD